MFQLADILESMNRGRTAKDIDATLQDVLDATVEHGKSAELTIKLKVTPTKRGVNEVTASVTAKLPQEKPEPAIFFVNAENKLVRDDPRQPPLLFPTTLRREDVPPALEHNA